MSVVEEDTELRDLVVQTLESNGVLGKLKAQVRASVFLALDEEEKKNPLENEELNSFVQTTEGHQVVSLFREFLKFYNLEYTLTVFEPEANVGSHHMDRASLAKEFGIRDFGDVAKHPIVCELLKKTKKHSQLFQRADHFDLDKLLSEKTHEKMTTNENASASSEVERNKGNRKNSDDSGSSISSIKIPSFADSIKAGNGKNFSGQEADYDNDDFNSSNKSVTPRDKKLKRSKSSKSPRGRVSGEEEFDEDIEEDINEDLSTNKSESLSKDEEMTSDRTISPEDQSVTCDYIEDVLKT